MSTLNLLKYANQGKLLDAKVMEFVAQYELQAHHKLNFSGILEIAEVCLDILFRGKTPDDLEGYVEGIESQAVDEALTAWLERQSPSQPVERRPTKPNLPPLEGKKEPLLFQHQEVEGERFTPTRLVNRLKNQLQSYIEGAYPLNDPILLKARRKLLEEEQDGKLLAQEPYVETTPRYKPYDGSYGDLGLSPALSKFFTRLSKTQREYCKQGESETILYPSLYEHQAKALRSFLVDGKDIIVATGTGSGKTECFLLPMLGRLFEEAHHRPDSFEKRGVRALILYPMNALVNDQLSRLRQLLGDKQTAANFPKKAKRPHPVFGMYTGRTPYPGPRNDKKDQERIASLVDYYLGLDDDLKEQLKRMGRYPAKDLVSFYGKEKAEVGVYQTGAKKGLTYIKHNWKERLHTHSEDRELLTRQEMIHDAGSLPGHSPDILITNYSMLEYMLMRPFERPLFEETKRWLAQEGNAFLLVLDEAHMYRGAKGAEVGFLLRRLRARLGIHDQPEKLRVICTSASLGSDAESLENMRRFAADLTGKNPAEFDAIVGERVVPQPCASGSGDFAEILAAIDLEKTHNAGTTELLQILQPVFAYFQKPYSPPKKPKHQEHAEEALLHHLYLTLEGQPVVNLLLEQTSKQALSLASLAQHLFPEHPHRVKATEALVTLGSIARKGRDEAGLIPTRIHTMFRGLESLYACINPCCSGRQEAPHQQASLGKLFARPQSSCDACGARVFEIHSCRDCGTPYLQAYIPSETISHLSFLWGETEGDLLPLQLLPIPPRYHESVQEYRIHLKTGYIDNEHSFPHKEVRSLWIFSDKSDNLQHTFSRCAICTPPDAKTRSKIRDFRTKGEQPFSALLEAQFSEQPPQKKEAHLPNQGRKVLVFSDGRQKAARLAPALEYSHTRDLFRQVLALASEELRELSEKENAPYMQGMEYLYPAVLYVCNRRSIYLFPEEEKESFREDMRKYQAYSLKEMIEAKRDSRLQNTVEYAKHLYEEMTDKFYSTSALGLGMLEASYTLRQMLQRRPFPNIGLNAQEQQILLQEWLRMQVESQCFFPQGAERRSFGENPWEWPVGIATHSPASIIPESFARYLEKVLKAKKDVEDVIAWFSWLVPNSTLERQEDVYYLTPKCLTLRVLWKENANWQVCKDCGRLSAQSLRQICSSCCGEMKEADAFSLQTRTGYYREQFRRAFDGKYLDPFGLTAAEHSAQLTGYDTEEAFNKTEKYELRFQDILLEGESPIDVLSCTTTMEVGIDIGTLSGVALRNIPPHVANYQQRAGRAGRRGRSVASVVTYAFGNSHDSYFYDLPEKIISGDVLPPVVYIENQQILQRHINAYLVQRFFHEKVKTDKSLFKLLESLGTVEHFLREDSACSLLRLVEWLHQNQSSLFRELKEWVPRVSYGLQESIPEVDSTIEKSIETLIRSLYAHLPIEENKRREEIGGVLRDSLERQLEQHLLEALIQRAIFPRYAFPTDVVTFWVSKARRKGDSQRKRTFRYEPQRDLQIALSEYAPGATLTIDKLRFTSAALYSPYEPSVANVLAKAQSYISCSNCGYISLQDNEKTSGECPCCGNEELEKHQFITPQGFAPDINEKDQKDYGSATSRSGQTTRAQLEVQDPPTSWPDILFEGRFSMLSRAQHLVTVNRGIRDRGYMICPSCGRTEPVVAAQKASKLFEKNKKGKPKRHDHPLDQGVSCDEKALGPFLLGHKFPTDVLLMKLSFSAPVALSTATHGEFSVGKPSRSALTSLVEAISLAASRTLQIDEGELSGNWSPASQSEENGVYMFLYDVLPGGAGYTKMVQGRMKEVLQEAEKLLSHCSCESSCYQCLRHYGNNFIHSALDRHLALSVLRYLRDGIIPQLEYAEKERVLVPLMELLRLKGFKKVSMWAEKNKHRIPLLLHGSDGSEIWIDLHHPLIRPEQQSSPLREQAASSSTKYVSVDTYTLRHNLPAAYRHLESILDTETTH